MSRKAKNIIIYLIIFIVIFGPYLLELCTYFFEESGYNPFDYARITEVDYTAVVDNDEGKITVTERLKYDVHAALKSNPFVELWRDLPEERIDGLYVNYKVNSVKQILEDGTEIPYDESSKLYWYDRDYERSSGYGPEHWYHSEGPYDEELRDYECLLFYVDDLYREEIVFEIEYEMYNAGLLYRDCSELYLAMYSGSTVNHLESFKGTILIENEYMAEEGNYFAHTYGTNSNSFNFIESEYMNPGYHTFEFELDKSDLKFKPHNEYIEFSLVTFNEDKDIFTRYANTNYYTFDNVLEELIDEQEYYENKYVTANILKTIILFVALMCSALIIWYGVTKHRRTRKKYKFYEPTMPVHYFREIPNDLDPQFAAVLAFSKESEKIKEKVKNNTYSAILLSLVRKKYIEVVKINEQLGWTNNNVKIIRKYNPNINIVKDMMENAEIKITKIDDTIENIEADTKIDMTPASTMLEELEKSRNEIQQEIVIEEPREELEPLSITEKLYFDLINRHCRNAEITIIDLQNKVGRDYQNTDSFIKNMEHSITNIGVLYGYFQKSNYEEPIKDAKSKSKLLCVVGILIMIIFNLTTYFTILDTCYGAFFILGFAFIGSGIYLMKKAKKDILLTQFGEDEYSKWKGLYNFLNSETLMNEREVIDLTIWEQYLVYATAFGISDKVVKALKVRCPEIIDSPIINNTYYHSNNFHYSSRSFRSTATRASSISRSIGYGGHGGYGGGGRGGGGGGGGH